MSAPFDLTDNSVVVVIGTGAGGGVLANELAQKGVSAVSYTHLTLPTIPLV